jgi:VanZ family protein
VIKYFKNNSILFSIGWVLFIFVLCCTPGKFIPHSSWLEILSFDKLVHASLFFILGASWLMVLKVYQKISFIFIVLVFISCICYGGLLEIMQATIFSQRSGDYYDFIANTFGVSLAFLFFRKEIS